MEMERTSQDQSVRIAVVQPWLAEETDEARLDRIRRLLDEAGGVDLVVLPELWRVGYANFAAYEARAEPLDGDTARFLSDEASDRGIHLLGGTLLERDGAHLYNTAVLFDPEGTLLVSYRKMHLLAYRSEERALLAPGHDPCVIETPIGTLGIAVCYDLRFPELFGAMAQAGAETFLVPAAWPHTRRGAWEALSRARAVENQAYVVACGAAGSDALGESAIIDPWGVQVAALGHREGVATARVDLDSLRTYRADFTAWRERELGA